MSETLEDSDYTAIQARIMDYAKNKGTNTPLTTEKENSQTTKKLNLLASLTPFIGDESLAKQDTSDIFFSQEDYFQLADVTGRLIREDKRGFIPPEIRPILSKLGVNPSHWVESVQHYGRKYFLVSGSVEKLQQMSDKLGQAWMQGVKSSQLLYS